ncbi:cation-independent mannose-6-phosphate receptor [Hylaeus volcanicus]|uniref:cation-independent mannose-6-phosphate receptor n=1 Tax=Hylaeus volcanicus TaxID=313075 RepID=UPI0023B7CA31|nr:cation-independent mannose-6-phosphate receptor [Hylaeus volcanicus]XP_053979421.1 cation-independent mannose-6-phosphate receptor [Hylaeus volcanicus]
MFELNILVSFYCLATVAVFVDTSVVNNNSFCVIKDPVFQVFNYNFTSLSDPTKDTILNDDYLNETVRMQLCIPLKQKCNGKDGYGICMTRNNTEIGIGKIPPKVNVKNGRILFVFTGDNCTQTENYTVNIIMKCDYEAGNNPHHELISHTEDQCQLYKVWKTALACAPPTVQNCTVIDNGFHYDLSPLTRYSENYVIRVGTELLPKIILNICHSVIFEYNALCQMRSGACLQKNTDSSKLGYTNLGDVTHPPFMENGRLKLEYQDGDMCTMKNISVPHIKTTIYFMCDFNAVDTIPEYIGGSEECHYQIIWKTAAACSIESLRNHSVITAGKCTVTNPLTNFTYNLQSLTHADYDVTAQNGIQYKFGVCKSLDDMKCSSETGVCLTKNSTSIGKFNTNLMWQEGGPYLNYTDGDLCENGRHRYTVIAFVCGAEGASNKPLVMEQSPCQLIIHWSTNLVCEKRIKCATTDNEINLSSLIKSTGNYIVKVDKNTEFHINICRPLVSVPGLTCAHGSAVCKAYLNLDNEYVNEVSLGFPKESPILDSNRETVLRYISGSPCPENPNKLISSNFTFPCRYNDKGSPEFKRYENCTYVFEWKTSLTCGAVMGNWASPCIIKDQLLSQECNLSLLHKDKKVYRVKNKQGKEYSISICGEEKFCSGSAVCQGSKGYGSLANVIFDYARDLIKLQYSNGDKCVNNFYTSEVRFICNNSVGIGEPKLLWESQCSVEFEWQTSVTCTCKSSPSDPTTSSNTHGNVEDFSSSHTGTVAGIVLGVIVLVAALLYFRDPDKRACLRSCWNPFSSRRGSGRVQYCRVDTTEEACLLLDVDPTQCQTDSDDDLLNA